MRKKECVINFNNLKKLDFYFFKKNTRKLDQEIDLLNELIL